MGCILSSKVNDTYVLGVLEPGEIVAPEPSVRGSKLKSSPSYRNQKQILKGKYKVDIADQKKSSTKPQRANSSPALGTNGNGTRRSRTDTEMSPTKKNTAAASARAKARFKRAGTSVKAAVRLKLRQKNGLNNGMIKRSMSMTSGAMISSSMMNKDNFQFMNGGKAIGKGAFSYVRLGQSKQNQRWYALKCICKEKACRHKNTPRHLRNEKEILSSIDNPFIIKCFGSFQDSTFIYLALEYVPGGELHRLIYHRKAFSIDMSIFYAAELLMALKFLHTRNIMYRDLKPENILITSDGHVKICDFGFATKLNGPDARATSKVGTPHYLAPEILDMHSQEGYTYAIDVWSWACVFYEMIRGRPAFGTALDTSYAVYIRVMKAKYKMPGGWNSQIKSLIKNLLEAKLEKRLTDIDSITSHVVFENVNWEAAASKRLRPPYVPRLKLNDDNNGVDHSHFDKWSVPNYRKATVEENSKFRDF